MFLDAPTSTRKDKRMLVLLALGSLIVLVWLCIVSFSADDQLVTQWQWSQSSDSKTSLYRAIGTSTNEKLVASGGKISPRAAFLLRLPFPINSAGLAELEMLPGIGPKLSTAIDTYRTRYGRITDKQTFMKVPGIGPKIAARLTPLLTFAEK